MLKAGFSRVDITPPLGTYLSGYFTDRYADGILDPIELNAVAVSHDGETVVLIAADMLGIRMNYCDDLRRRISEKTGVPAKNVMIASLHQHSSIAIGNTASNTVHKDHGYLDVLYRKFVDVAQMAVHDLADATLCVGAEQTAEQIAFIRRWMMTDGTILSNPSRDRVDELDHPLGEADNTVRLLRFQRENQNDIALINFSTHPDVVGGTKFSADWPGFARRYVEKDLENVSCMLLVGAQGDSNHFNFTAGRRDKGYAYSAHMGRVIADAVIGMWDRTGVQEVDRLTSDILVVYNQTRMDGIDRYEECKALVEEHNRRRQEKSTKSYNTGGAQIGEAERIVNIRNAPIYQKVPVTTISLGKTAIVGFGGEPFLQYAAAVREAYPDRFIVCACAANGYEDYLPTAAAIKEGGYEADRSPFSETLEEEVVGTAIELLKKG